MQPRPVCLRYPDLFRDARRLIRNLRLGGTYRLDRTHRLIELACTTGPAEAGRRPGEWDETERD